MSGGVEMARTTFYRHKCAIEDIFGILIDCDKKNGNKYFIGNKDVLHKDSVQNWMLSTLSVSNIVGESSSLYNRILLENIPSGDEKLHQVISAMKENRMVTIWYQRYTSASNTLFILAPYSVKLFQRRWYLLGKYEDSDNLGTFSFDRMEEVEISDKKFKMPDDFDAAAYFSDSFGIVVDNHIKTERIVLRAYGNESCYLRDLPLHHSQREINATDEYTDFEIYLKLTDDFKAKLLSRGEWLEVLAPQSLAGEMVEWHQGAINRYKKKGQAVK
jgi:predicted DNA-binding transcriptional regulator YafY